MSESLLRVYFDPAEIGTDGYPFAWHKGQPAVKDLVREQAGHRCIRCGHPYRIQRNGNVTTTPGHQRSSPVTGKYVQVSKCDDGCRHGGPVIYWTARGGWEQYDGPDETIAVEVYAIWRVLTVHHLNGVKHDCRWWNLTSLCQRCHLTIQGKVHLTRPWRREHSDWFKPYVAGFYAWHFLGEEISRDEAMSRLDELLALEHVQMELS